GPTPHGRKTSVSSLCFFLQAEDGIRDFHVTGVQTCALPILPPGTGPLSPDFSGMNPALMAEFIALLEQAHAVLREETGAILAERSEERRVGKEGRSRWGRCQAERPRGPQTAAVRKRRTLPAP